jgi:hypothetical protein
MAIIYFNSLEAGEQIAFTDQLPIKMGQTGPYPLPSYYPITTALFKPSGLATVYWPWFSTDLDYKINPLIKIGALPNGP